MSSDNQFTATGAAAIGFQTNSASITTGADIEGNTVGAIIVGQSLPNSLATCGAIVRAINPDPGVDLSHVPQGSGLLAFGDAFALLGMNGTEFQNLNGQVDGLGLPFTTNYAVVGASTGGPGVLGVAGGISGPGAPTGAISPYLAGGNTPGTGVMGACTDGPGVTGISPKNPGVFGVSDSVGVVGGAPASQGFPQDLGNVRGVGVMGKSANLGVVGVGEANLDSKTRTLISETHGVGVLGVSPTVGVQGISIGDRGGVFQNQSTAKTPTAQMRLVPIALPFRTAIQLPAVGKIGDMLALETSLPTLAGTDPHTDCHLYLCTQGSFKTFPAKWSEVTLKPV
jgi:hypothetical protein